MNLTTQGTKSMKRSIIAVILVLNLYAAALASGAEITIGPVLERPGSDTMAVMWETDIPVNSSVILTDPSGKKTEVPSLEKGVYHLVTLSGLKPGTSYKYQVVGGGSVIHEASFVTFDGDDSYRIALMGDSRDNPKTFRKLLLLIEKNHPYLIVHLGDMIHGTWGGAVWKKYLFDVGRDVFDHIPLVAVLGNHDLDEKGRADLYAHYFPPPKSTPEGRLYYTFSLGGDLFVVLDVYTVRPFFAFTEGMWLLHTLKEASRDPRVRHIFVLSHEGVLDYSNSRRGFFGLKLFTGVMGRRGVTALITSHDHHYVRGNTYSGVPFIITGGGGAPLYDIENYNPFAILTGRKVFALKTYHMLLMDVRGDVVTFTAIEENGKVIDRTTIRKSKR